MPPASTSGPSQIARTARAKDIPLAQPVWPPAPALSSTSPSAPASIAFSACRIDATSANTTPPTSCRRATIGAGDPTLASTIGTRWRTSTSTSAASRSGCERMMMFGHTGATGASARAQSSSMRVSQASSASALRALTVGNEPITPARQAAETSSGPETRSIGAAISGSRRRAAIVSGRLMERFRGLEAGQIAPCAALTAARSTAPAAVRGSSATKWIRRGRL